SYLARMNHLNSSIYAIKESPWVGLGYQSTKRIYLSNELGLVNNSIGFFSTAMNFGLVYLFFYIAVLFKKIKKYQKFNLYIFTLIFVIISMSQAIFDYPILIMFLFTFQRIYSERNL